MSRDLISALVPESAATAPIFLSPRDLMNDGHTKTVIAGMGKGHGEPSHPDASDDYRAQVKRAIPIEELGEWRKQQGQSARLFPAFAPKEWQEGIAAELRRMIGMHEVYTIPEDFWVLVEKLAWTTPAQVLWTAERIEAAIRQQAPIYGSHFPVIRIAPETYWLLLAMAFADESIRSQSSVALPAPTQRWGRFFRRRRSAAQPPRVFSWAELRAMERLRQIGETVGFKHGRWASLWDQWLMLEAARFGQPKQWSPLLRASVATLPLRRLYPDLPALRQLDDPAGTSSGVQAIELAQKRWKSALQPWLEVWLQRLDQ